MLKHLLLVKDHHHMLSPRKYYLIGGGFILMGLIRWGSAFDLGILDLGIIPWMGLMFLMFGYAEQVSKKKRRATPWLASRPEPGVFVRWCLCFFS